MNILKGAKRKAKEKIYGTEADILDEARGKLVRAYMEIEAGEDFLGKEYVARELKKECERLYWQTRKIRRKTMGIWERAKQFLEE